MADYNEIFTMHINRILDERKITKSELAEIGGVSTAFVTALTRGEANPTLKTMQALSEGLGIPLPLLLRPIDAEEWQTILRVISHSRQSEAATLPPGFEHVKDVVLPAHKAFQVREWCRNTLKRIGKGSYAG